MLCRRRRCRVLLQHDGVLLLQMRMRLLLLCLLLMQRIDGNEAWRRWMTGSVGMVASTTAGWQVSQMWMHLLLQMLEGLARVGLGQIFVYLGDNKDIVLLIFSALGRVCFA